MTYKKINHSHIIKSLPNIWQKTENISIVTYKLGKKVRNNILNYKDAVNSIYLDEEVSFSIDTDYKNQDFATLIINI